MSDIRHSLLRRDALSAAKEVLYHLDIYFSSQLQSAPLPLVDKGPAELLEEFLFQVPKERGAPPKVGPDRGEVAGGEARRGSRGLGTQGGWRARPRGPAGALVSPTEVWCGPRPLGAAPGGFCWLGVGWSCGGDSPGAAPKSHSCCGTGVCGPAACWA